ncbi:MAG: mobile mystery protein A [Leptospiraceae bacterium]|nr:mobile mystery protein A [Leptospiraceae bacterium]MCP5499849.1 mobile mystery protein A [Leptospiraceae bacterium]
MKDLKQKLILKQVDKKISIFSSIDTFELPGEGWIYSIRTALKMTLKQLGRRMGISPQSVSNMEKREKVGTVTLKTLKDFAQAMDMEFVYGFIPRDKSLEKLIEKRALELATEIIQRTSLTMKLEDQEISKERLEEAINERKKKIMDDMPGYLWD